MNNFMENNQSNYFFSNVQVYQILKDPYRLQQSTDHLKIKFIDIGIDENRIQSFGLSFWFTLNNRKLNEDETYLFQIGENSLNKQFQIGFNKDKSMFINFVSIKGQIETIFTEECIKMNKQYFFQLSVQQNEIPVDVTAYLNGQIQVKVSFTNYLLSPKGMFYIGSEKASSCFIGEIRDVNFYNRDLNNLEINQLYNENKQNNNNVTFDIIKNNQQQFNYSMSQNKKTGVPLNIVRDFQQDLLSDLNKSKEQKQSKQQDEVQQNLSQLKEILNKDEQLLIKIRKLIENFEWIFLTLQLISPPIEQPGKYNWIYECVLTELNKKSQDYPIYAIEIPRFMRVIQQLQTGLTHQSISMLAKSVDLIYFSQEFQTEYIKYDKFLVFLRNSCMTKNEILILKTNYRYDRPDLDNPDVMDYTLKNPEEMIGKLEIQIQKDTQLCEIKPSSISVIINKESNIILEIEMCYKRITDNQEYNYKFQINNYDRNNKSVLFENKVQFEDTDLIKKVVLKFSERYQYLIGIVFHLKNREEKRLNFFLDKDYTLVECLPDDNVKMNEWVVDEDSFFSLFECYLVKHNHFKYLGGLIAYTVKSDLYDRYISKLNAEHNQNELEQLPFLSEECKLGKFQIIINHCHGCQQHQKTFKHNESTFLTLVYKIGNQLKDQYPNMEILSNFDDYPNTLEHFDIYIRGVGPISQRDSKDRIFLFRKTGPIEKFSLNFNKLMIQVNDILGLIIMGYGDTNELQAQQETFLNNNKNKYKRSDYCVDIVNIHLNEKSNNNQYESEHNQSRNIANGQNMTCRNWGCNKTYMFDDNPSNIIKNCRHHPGVFEFGSTNGLWPEHWTCCRQSWEAQGCIIGFHKGEPVGKNFINMRFCINRGQLNPITHKPDSCCGQFFNTKEKTGCIFHSGYKVLINGQYKWNCENGCRELTDPPCTIEEHQTAYWPQEEAKLLFIRKPLQDFSNSSSKKKINLQELALDSDYYKQCKPYNEEVNRRKFEAQKLIDTENEKRYCLHWACEKEFTHYNNMRNDKLCRYHPGRYDFGHTGLTISETYSEYHKQESDKILWKAHWTCCRKQWDDYGCTRGRHKGPLISEMKPRKYIWPNEHAMKYFFKEGSKFWQNKLNNEGVFDPNKVSQILDYYIKRNDGKLTLSNILPLADTLKLHLAVCSKDLSFHFKFIDVMNSNLSAITHDGELIDKQLFMKWWFADLDTIRPLNKNSTEGKAN